MKKLIGGFVLFVILFTVWMILPIVFRQTPTSVEPLSNGQQEGELKEFYVQGYQWGFNPDTIEVNKGDRVRIIGTSNDVKHSFDLSEFGVDLDLEVGKNNTIEFVANKAGTFQFYCDVFCGRGHSSMTGRLVVNE
ncbi:MAG: hypothetical protein GOV01_00715 [Candidatus Altiarchaeota archaeon]|nr:hypothetical protein [Candidatus Altiarchaeota archaeon]